MHAAQKIFKEAAAASQDEIYKSQNNHMAKSIKQLATKYGYV